MSSEESPDRRRAIPTQRGRKRQKLGGTLQRFWASHRIGPPRSDIRHGRIDSRRDRRGDTAVPIRIV